MSISNLRCTREGAHLAVIWSWDAGQSPAQVTITRLLDGETLVSKEIGKQVFLKAIASPARGPVFEVPFVPLCIEVRDADGAETIELIDRLYTVEWRLARQNIYQRRGLFGGQTLVGTDVTLQLLFPCDDQVPSDMFYYVLTAPGRREGENAPVGYLPSLRPGKNAYGVIVPGGRSIELRCNPRHEAVSRLFNFKRLPDVER